MVLTITLVRKHRIPLPNGLSESQALTRQPIEAGCDVFCENDDRKGIAYQVFHQGFYEDSILGIPLQERGFLKLLYHTTKGKNSPKGDLSMMFAYSRNLVKK